MTPPRALWWCPCGATFSHLRSAERHVRGETMCQHREIHWYFLSKTPRAAA